MQAYQIMENCGGRTPHEKSPWVEGRLYYMTQILDHTISQPNK